MEYEGDAWLGCDRSFRQRAASNPQAAQQELERMASSVDDGGKESLKKVVDHLEEGASSLKMHQKHIKVADHLDYGWGAVRHYQSDPLANDSDDEKQLRRADKEAKKDFEESEAFNRKTARGGRGGRRGRHYNPYKHYDSWADGPGPSARRCTATSSYVSRTSEADQAKGVGSLLHLWWVWPPGMNMPLQRKTVSF